MKSKCVIFVLLLCGCTQMSINPKIKAQRDSNTDFNSKSTIFIEGFDPNIRPKIDFQLENVEVINAKNCDIIVYEEQ